MLTFDKRLFSDLVQDILIGSPIVFKISKKLLIPPIWHKVSLLPHLAAPVSPQNSLFHFHAPLNHIFYCQAFSAKKLDVERKKGDICAEPKGYFRFLRFLLFIERDCMPTIILRASARVYPYTLVFHITSLAKTCWKTPSCKQSVHN